MQQFYTLEQVVEILGLSPDKVKEMARKGEIRSFQDRGTLRFRSQEIDEHARLLGRGSDPGLELGETTMHPPANPTQMRRGPAAKPEEETFLLADDAEVPLGQTPAAGPGASKSGGGKRKPAHVEPPTAASDSDVRLVLDNSDLDFNLSEVDAPAPAKKPENKTHLRKPGEKGSDSDVKLDSADKMSSGEHDVALGASRPKTLSDSDIRLETVGVSESSGKHEPMITEDIDLDAEAEKQGSDPTLHRHSPKTRLPDAPKLPTSSPFELSGQDLAPKKPGRPTKSAGKTPEKAGIESSEDFELKPRADDSSPLMLGSSEIDLMVEGGAGLDMPSDAGISLEADEEDAAPAQSKGKPLASKHNVDSSSEFEISLDDSDSSPSDSPSDSDSEFELSLDVDSSSELKALDAEPGSDSEFELTLDEAESSSSVDEEEKDIFETDFEVPALDDESGSEAVAIEESDTDLEGSSEFELSLSEEDVAMDSEGGELVEVDESADAAAATLARPRMALAGKGKKAPAGDDDLEVDLDAEDDIEPVDDADVDDEPAPVYAPAKPAQWGALPGVMLIFSSVFLFLGGLMSFELVQNMMGYQSGSPTSTLVIRPLARMIDDSIPKD